LALTARTKYLKTPCLRGYFSSRYFVARAAASAALSRAASLPTLRRRDPLRATTRNLLFREWIWRTTINSHIWSRMNGPKIQSAYLKRSTRSHSIGQRKIENAQTPARKWVKAGRRLLEIDQLQARTIQLICANAQLKSIAASKTTPLHGSRQCNARGQIGDHSLGDNA